MSQDTDIPTSISSAEQWKKSSKADAGPLEVPSGNVALVRNPGLHAFLQAGLVPNPLLAVATKALEGKVPDFKEVIEEDPSRMEAMLEMADNVVCYVVVEPKVHPIPIDENGRKRPELKVDELLYVDDVDAEDKWFIFQWSMGGTRDLERFREQLEAGVGGSSLGEDVQLPAKRAPRASSGRTTAKGTKPRRTTTAKR